MKHTSIKIERGWLTSVYSVYIAIIKHKDSSYYYVGQTGDTNSLSARSPFYRLSAHLGYGKSTQNQIYEALKLRLNVHNQEEMEKWFSDSTIEIHSFETDEFNFNPERDTHLKNRRKTLAIETAIIKHIDETMLLNISKTSSRDWKNYEPDALEILRKLNIYPALVS